MTVTITRATAQDIPAVISVLNYGVKNKIRRGDLAWGETDIDPASITHFVQNGTAYIASIDEKIVGTFMLDWQDEVNWGKQPPSSCYLQRFAVAAGYGGQNIGGQILEQVAKIIKEQGALSSIRLVCPSANTKLRAYYEKQGFVRADAKAHPTLPRQHIVYYERAIGDATPEAALKTSPWSKFHGFKFSRSSHE